MRSLLLTTALTLAALQTYALPAQAIDWGHSSDEPIVDGVRAAAGHLTAPAFQVYLGVVNAHSYGQRVRRTGWVVDAYTHPGIKGHSTVHISNRVDRAGVSWTIYAPASVAMSLQAGDQVEWEGAVRSISASGEITLMNERILRRVSPAGYGQPVLSYAAMRPTDAPWWTQSLAERPVIRREALQLPYEAIKAGTFANPVVRLWVAPTGMVPRAELVHSSGRSDVDQAAVDSVRRWRFQPFPPGRGEDQLGEITLPVKAF